MLLDRRLRAQAERSGHGKKQAGGIWGGIALWDGTPDGGQAGHLGEGLAEWREALEREGAFASPAEAAELVVVQAA